MSDDLVEGYCDPRFQAVRDQFAQALASGFDTGASVAVEHQGEMVVNLWGGYKDREKTDPWSDDTLINVFSTTKAITATCFLQLVERGKVDLDALVGDYWPEYACNGKEKTRVSDFLCHRAAMHGFQGGVPQFDYRHWDQWTEALAQQRPFREPGTTQGYHALTYGWLVGELIRRIDGRSVGQYFHEEIAEPFNLDFKIGLEDQDIQRCGDILVDPQPTPWVLMAIAIAPDFVLPKSLRSLKSFLRMGDLKVAFASKAAQLGGTNTREMNTREWREAEIPSANGHGTAESLAKLFGILSSGGERDGKRIISTETLKLALTPLSEGPDTVILGEPIRFGVGYDLGLGITTIRGTPHPSRIFGHCGVGGTVAFGDPETGLGYGFLCNRMHKPKDLYQTSNRLTRTVLDIVS
ncbi:MAG TPA: serine hydrolase [Halieaceae bacterium]|nr:serine hydrolase [Halieaceae bacterium]